METPTADEYAEKYKSVFLVSADKISPNPMQPRREFDEEALQSLADSIRQYGVLQPLVVTRHEEMLQNGTRVTYELISGERRLRASKIAGLAQVPVVIHDAKDENVKLELAIIENLQRDDLHPLERALAFQRLVSDFGLKQAVVAERVGKSRPFVTNSIRLLALPQEIQDAFWKRSITEGHARALLSLVDRPNEMASLFKDTVEKNLRVREVEAKTQEILRGQREKRANNAARLDSELQKAQETLSNALGTRVSIDEHYGKGKIAIEFFSREELAELLRRVIDIGEMQNGSEDIPSLPESAAAEVEEVVENPADDLDELMKKFPI